MTGSGARRREDIDRLDAEAEIALTERQQDVTRLIAEGLSAKEIAYRLSISTKTVEFHRRKSMEKRELQTLPNSSGMQ